MHVSWRALVKSRRGAVFCDVEKRYRNRGVRLSRTIRQLSGRSQTRYKRQHHDYHQYRDQDIAIPGILLGMYPFPFVPLSHCLTPYCTLQHRLQLDNPVRRLASRAFTYFPAFFSPAMLAMLGSDQRDSLFILGFRVHSHTNKPLNAAFLRRFRAVRAVSPRSNPYLGSKTAL